MKALMVATFLGIALGAIAVAATFRINGSYSWTATAGDVIAVNGSTVYTVPALTAGTSKQTATLSIGVSQQ